MNKFNELDIVVSAKSINSFIPKGCLGTIVHVVDANLDIFLVEFIDDEKVTIDVAMVGYDDIIKIK